MGATRERISMGGNARVAKPRVTASGASARRFSLLAHPAARYLQALARCYQTRSPQREPARKLDRTALKQQQTLVEFVLDRACVLTSDRNVY